MHIILHPASRNMEITWILEAWQIKSDKEWYEARHENSNECFENKSLVYSTRCSISPFSSFEKDIETWSSSLHWCHHWIINHDYIQMQIFDYNSEYFIKSEIKWGNDIMRIVLLSATVYTRKGTKEPVSVFGFTLFSKSTFSLSNNEYYFGKNLINKIYYYVKIVPEILN